MQLIETSPFGLRAARHRFVGPDRSQSVTLFPMVHVGEPAFYEAVNDDAYRHDVALVEGVGPSPVGRHLARTYRWIDGSRLGLIVQPRAPRDGMVAARIVRADLTAEEFHREWRRLPLWQRLLVFLAVPIVGLRHRWFSSRESIARRLDMDDYHSRDETLSWDPTMTAFRRSILGARDARLVERLGEELDRPDAATVRIAIIFGAAHMRAVLGELNRRGFRSVESDWLTIFPFD